MRSLELCLLGRAQVWRGGREIKLTRKSLALVAYLALEGQATRAQVAALLWGGFETTNANGNLRRELHRLRQTEVRDHLTAGDGTLSLKAFSTDLDDETAPGELLGGFELDDAPEFDAWLEEQRTGRAQNRLEALRAAAQRMERSNLPEAIRVHSEIVALEPLSDLNAQSLIACLIANGQRDEAERVFEAFKARLADVGSTPALETAQVLLSDGTSPLGSAALLERVGRGKEALDFRIAAAVEATERGDHEAALAHLAIALEFQRLPKERAKLYELRLELLHKLARTASMEAEVAALESNSLGDARLEGLASLRRAIWQHWQQDFPGTLLHASNALENPFLPAARRGMAFYLVGTAHFKMGQLGQAETAMRAAIELLPPDDAVAERILAHHGLAQLALQHGNVDAARSWNRTAIALLNETDERHLRPSVLCLEATLALFDNEAGRALHLLTMARRECEQGNNQQMLPMVLVNLSRAHTLDGQLGASTEVLEEALGLIERVERHPLKGTVLNNLALNYLQRGQLGMGLNTGWAAIENARQSGDLRAIAFRSLAHIELLVQVGDLQSARRCLTEAQEIVERVGLGELVPWCQLQEAEILLAEGQADQALQILAQLENPADQEVRNAALYVAARAAERLGRKIPADTYATLGKAKKWQASVLPLQLRQAFSPQVRAAAHAALEGATALQELELRAALGLPVQALIERLTHSLELHPQLQARFAQRLNTQLHGSD